MGIINRINLAINGRLNSGTILKYLGCSIDELKRNLEKQFYNHPETDEPMSWKNHGINGWHIDHIIPFATIKNMYDKRQIKKVCHFTNLQPLWATQNLRKGAKLYDKIL